MMMTINTNNKFFWSSYQKNFIVLKLKVTVLTLCLSFLTACQDKEQLEVKPFPTSTGWGYEISYNEKTIIKQTIIPAISSQKSFMTKEDALKTGNLVKEKLEKRELPSLTEKDLLLLKIKF